MKKIILWVIGFVWLMWAITACAVRMSSLYQASIPVASQSAEERNQVIPQVLSQVLIKVTGNNQVMNNPNLKTYLTGSNNLVEEFSYTSTSGPKPYLLQLNFDPDGIDKLLQDAGVATWGQNRPLILVWLEREIPGKSPALVNNDMSDDTITFLKQNADRRGLPIIFPVMDVTDLNLVSANDIANMAMPKLTTAAKRYESDAILIGRLIRVPTGFNTQWRLVLGNDQWNWTVTGATIADVMTQIADNVTDTLAARFATVVTNTVQAKIQIRVVGMTQGDDISALLQYLKHLTPVADVQLAQVTQGDVVLTISLRSTPQAFTQAVSIGQKLTPLPATNNSPISTYQWNH